jgi:hypothetical protein
MSQTYHETSRAFQDRFDTRRLADRLAESTSDTIDETLKRFIEARDMFFVATAIPEGWPESSYKGGEPGFVRVIDDHTLVFPVYNGNGMYLTVGNIAANPRVGLLFIDFETGTRLRMNGDASIDQDDRLVETYPGAQLVVRVRAREVFPNCRRYVHRYQLVERSPFVPPPAASRRCPTGSATHGSQARCPPTIRLSIPTVRAPRRFLSTESAAGIVSDGKTRRIRRTERTRGLTTSTTKPEKEVAAFTAEAVYGTCAEVPPYDVYQGTGQPGTVVEVSSPYGSGRTEVGENGMWEVRVYFPEAPLGETFEVLVEDSLGRKKSFGFTHVE